MGIFESIFSGDKGVGKTLFQTFGTPVVVKKKMGSVRDETTGAISPVFTEYAALFVPTGDEEKKTSAKGVGDGSGLTTIFDEFKGFLRIDNYATELNESSRIVYCDTEYDVVSFVAKRIEETIEFYKIAGVICRSSATT